MDKLQWFKFSPANWFMGKINRCDDQTQIAFIRLCCIYWNKECVLSYENAQDEVDSAQLKTLVNKRIIKVEENLISIHFLDEQYTEILATSDKRRNAALSRWNANGMQVHASALQNDADKSRVDKREIREEKIINIPFETFWNLYDKKKDRFKSEKKWKTLNDKDREAIIQYVPKYKKESKDPHYRKHPTTFLNSRIWEDDSKPINNDLIYYRDQKNSVVRTHPKESFDQFVINQAKGGYKVEVVQPR